MQQFYSGYYNKRTDEWGGNLQKRMKFPLEVVDACIKIREKYKKPEFIIGYRLSPEEPFDDGITMTETLALVKELMKRPLQFIDVSQSKFFQEARALMLNKDLGILLKEGKKDKINLEIDPEHPEQFQMPKMLWGMSIQEGSLIGFKIKKK